MSHRTAIKILAEKASSSEYALSTKSWGRHKDFYTGTETYRQIKERGLSEILESIKALESLDNKE